MFLAYHIETVEVPGYSLGTFVYVLDLESVTEVIPLAVPPSSATVTIIMLPEVVEEPKAAEVYVPVPGSPIAVKLWTNAIAIIGYIPS